METHVPENLSVLDFTYSDKHHLKMQLNKWYHLNLNPSFQCTKITYLFTNVILTNLFDRYVVV